MTPPTHADPSADEAALMAALQAEGGAREWPTRRRRALVWFAGATVSAAMLLALGLRHDVEGAWLERTFFIALGVFGIGGLLTSGVLGRVQLTPVPRSLYGIAGTLVAFGALYSAIAFPDAESVPHPVVAAAVCFAVSAAVAIPVALVAFWLDRRPRTARHFAQHLAAGAAFGPAVLITHCPIDAVAHAAAGHLGLMLLSGGLLAGGAIWRRR